MPLPMPPSRSGEGFRLLDLGLLDEATKAFQAGLQVDPNDAKCLLGLARSQAAAGNSNDALINFEKLLARKPEHLEARSHRALILALRGDASGIRDVEAAASDRRAAFHEHLNLALYLAAKGDPRAQGEFEYALRVEPKSSKVLLELGKLAERSGDGLRALRLYQQAAAFAGGTEYLPFVTVARAHRLVGESRAAAGAMVEAIKRAPKVKELYPECYQYCMDGEDYDNAFKTAVGLRQFEPDNATYLVWQALSQGLASLGQENVNEARKILEVALERDPSNIDIKIGLARVSALAKEEKKAIDLFNEVLRERQDPTAAAELAWVYCQRTPPDSPNIMAVSERALKVHPDNPRLHFFMAVGLLTADRPEEALPHVQRAVATLELSHRQQADALLEKTNMLIRRNKKKKR